MELDRYGWARYRNSMNPVLPDNSCPARIIADYGRGYKTISERGTEKILIVRKGDRPVIGDWVSLEGEADPVIGGVLPRMNTVSRKAAGKEFRGQLLAANIDMIILLFSAWE